MRFYCIKWPLEKGIIVCEGTVSDKRAQAEKGHSRFTMHRTTFLTIAKEFTCDLAVAKKSVANSLLDAIRFHELRIERLKRNLDRVRDLDDKAEVWTATGDDDEEGSLSSM